MIIPVTRAVVLVPTYNESEVIERLIIRLSKVRDSLQSGIDTGIDEKPIVLDLMVIDDNSPDNTAAIVERLGIEWISLLKRPVKGGLGPAYIAGFKKALEDDYSLMIEMDADLSHQPEELSQMIAPVINDQADLTIGTRWMPGGRVVNWPLYRQLISRLGTSYARLALRLGLRDVTSGYRVFRREVLESVDLDSIEARGYGFQIEMTLRTLGAGYRVQEVPITFIEREGGVSKMSKKIVLEALWKVTVWGFRGLTNRR
ncbi:MAG: polyprenol monophosphomannose synthase [Candidatus Nanopelagicaceae bacterium]